MLNVYVSSTYDDLVELRRSVVYAINKLNGYHVVYMENYTADTRKPLEKCLDDVRSCQIYVGLLGSRAGFVPEGEREAITRLEYDAAREKRLSCLFFVLPERFKPSQDADDVARIRAFRDLAQREHTWKRIEDEDEIGLDVLAALFAEAQQRMGWGAGSGFPPLLPFACDRIPQRQTLQLAMARSSSPEDDIDGKPSTASDESPRAAGTTSQSPSVPTPSPTPVCVIHGVHQQAPDKFVEWLTAELLGKIVGERVSELAIQWPRRTASDRDFSELLVGSIAEVAQVRRPTHKELMSVVSERPHAYFFSTRLVVGDWREEDAARLVAFCDFFSPWNAVDNPPKAIVIWYTYQPPVAKKPYEFWKSDDSKVVNERIRNAIGELAKNRPTVKVLDELESVPLEDAEDWARDLESSGDIGTHDLAQQVTQIYARHRRATLDMRTLAEELASLLRTIRKGPPP